MRVLLITHFYSSHRGGIEIVAEQLARRLIDRGTRITWAASHIDQPPDIAGLTPLVMRCWNPTEATLNVPFPFWGPLSLLRLWKAVGGHDVVHLHDCLYPGNVAGFFFAKLRGKPAVITQHIGSVPYKSRLLRTLLSVAYKTIGRVLLSGADRVVFISHAAMEHFRSRLTFKHTPEVMPNGVDTAVYSPGAEESDRERARQALGLTASPLLLFVGRFVEKKGIERLRLLAQNFPHVQWMFAGWGPNDPEQWQLPNVRVIRDRSGQKLVELYRAADLLVLPSVGEGFPLVVQEAMACGTPALISTETACAQPDVEPHLLHEPVFDKDDHRTVARWKDRINSLLSNPADLVAMRSTVAREARHHWSWERCADHYRKIFSQLT